MSRQDVETIILIPMQRQYLPPRNMDEISLSATLGDYATALEFVDPSDLKAAWLHVVSTHDKRSWPLPAVFVLAAREARRDRVGETRVERKAPESKTRPHVWWNQRPYLWHPSWQESDIPITEIRRFQETKERMQAAGEFGWADDDFYGLYRKNQAEKGQKSGPTPADIKGLAV